MTFISKVVAIHKETPFISQVQQLGALCKMVLIVMAKVRRDASADDGSGVVVCDKGMTTAAIRERLTELMGTIANDRQLDQSMIVNRRRTLAGKAFDPDNDPELLNHTSSVEDDTAKAQMFEDALTKLYDLRIVSRVLPRPGYNKVVYLLHGSYMFSDLVSALKGDALAMYVNQR